MKNQGILFDLDGTLWEVTDTTFECANEISKKYNMKKISKETICKVMGLNKLDAAKLYFPYLEEEKSLNLMEEISNLNIKKLTVDGGNVYNGLEDVLKILKDNYELFIVSNTGHKEYIEAFLTSSNLGKYFKNYIAASELNISKADAIKKVINDYSLEKYVYVGDTIKDFEATNKANVQFIQAKYGFGEDLKTEYSINSINELPDVVKSIFY